MSGRSLMPTEVVMKVTVLGATGGIGRATVSELASRGHAVTAASRTISAADVPPDVTAVPTDLLDPIAAAAACAGADVVVMAASVPYSGWHTRLGALVDAATDAAAAAGARLVMVDNLYMYGSPGTPISEQTPEAATSRKGAIRREIGRRLLAAHQEGRVRVAIGRLSDYYGPHGENSAVSQVGILPAIRGKHPRAYLDADQPHTFHFLPDAGRCFATLAERPEADGRPWILPAAPPVTQRELYTTLGRVLERELRIGRITPAMLWLAGRFDRELREAGEVTDQFDRPYTTDATAFQAAFGPVRITPHDEALQATVAAVRQAEGVAG
jgi:nucleoside-diphosphate-sugar epimerase